MSVLYIYTKGKFEKDIAETFFCSKENYISEPKTGGQEGKNFSSKDNVLYIGEVKEFKNIQELINFSWKIDEVGVRFTSFGRKSFLLVDEKNEFYNENKDYIMGIVNSLIVNVMNEPVPNKKLRIVPQGNLGVKFSKILYLKISEKNTYDAKIMSESENKKELSSEKIIFVSDDAKFNKKEKSNIAFNKNGMQCWFEGDIAYFSINKKVNKKPCNDNERLLEEFINTGLEKFMM